MKKIVFTLITIFLLSFSAQTFAADTVLSSLIPGLKNCNYVTDKNYEPFSDIAGNFPGMKGIMTVGKDGSPCVKVAGGTEGLLTLLFTTAITIIIVLTVISISVAGIQYMTEQATGQIAGGAKKRLQNSFVALGLGLLSYTILYTINKQLVDFTFNPASIDISHSVDKGIADANAAKQLAPLSTSISAIESVMAPVYQVGNPGFTPSPTGWVNPYTKTPCTPTPAVPFVGPVQTPPTTAANPCVQQSTFMGTFNGANPTGFGGTGIPQAPGTDIQAKFTNINNSTLNKASADGVLSLSGVNYSFRSGGGGNGYLPPGTYTITNGRLRNDVSSVMVDGFGYSFDLSDAFDARTNASRELLRIHPDGGGPGTIGCIGIQGPRTTQEQFYNSLKSLLAANGGKYTIKVGM